MNFDSKKIMPRYFFVIVVLSLGGLYIIGNAAYLMMVRAWYWEEVSQLFVRENVPIRPHRGNILSSDGQVMASSLPEYKIYMDFRVVDKDTSAMRKMQAWRDSAYRHDLDSICIGLQRIFPDKRAAWFKKRLEEGRKKRSRHWEIYNGRISYIQYKECKELPLFKERAYRSGFHHTIHPQRKKPFGSLASRTLGAIYASKDSARFGLELSYDSILRGQPGKSHRTKVRDKWLSIVDVPPINGNDILTTIDVRMQDVAEKALRNKLKEVGGDVGVAVVMEVKTGDIKAIVNLDRFPDGTYREKVNHAVSSLMEPGSTFKTASIMVALEDGKITKYDSIQTGNGQWLMHGRTMKDHNWRRGGYGKISVPEILMYSSNIGVSRIIDENYYEHPEKYVDGLYREGMGIPLGVPLVGSANSRIRRLQKNSANWSKTALAWMSIGYETQVPPINTLTFYNAIANNGKMVRPRFVRAEMKNGEIVREFPIEVIKERICSDKTLKDIQEILEMVVSKGLGKKAGNKMFKVSGKTGTAQVAQGAGGYRSGVMNYLVSFCGYFPSDNPQYSCIVTIKKKGLPASGGGQCGPVFSEISQSIMTQGVFRDVEEAYDTSSVLVPAALHGNLHALRNTLESINIKYDTEEQNDTINPHSTWCKAQNNRKSLSVSQIDIPTDRIPDVRGMGARDAVYLLRSCGLKVKLRGTGIVKHQSPSANEPMKAGQTIRLELQKK